MNKAISIFIPAFVVVMIFNQMLYGACFKAYCLSAAFPKVTILALAISIFIYYITKQEEQDTSGKQRESLNLSSKIDPIQEEVTIASHPNNPPAHTKVQEYKKTYSVDKVREEHKNAYKEWSENDDELLMKLYSEGMSVSDLCNEFGRQNGGIRSRLKKLKLL